jgi:hypothetical protein
VARFPLAFGSDEIWVYGANCFNVRVDGKPSLFQVFKLDLIEDVCGTNSPRLTPNRAKSVSSVGLSDVTAFYGWAALGYWPKVNAASSLATAWSMVKLAALWRGGNSTKVCKNWVMANWAAKAM